MACLMILAGAGNKCGAILLIGIEGSGGASDAERLCAFVGIYSVKKELLGNGFFAARGFNGEGVRQDLRFS